MNQTQAYQLNRQLVHLKFLRGRGRDLPVYTSLRAANIAAQRRSEMGALAIPTPIWRIAPDDERGIEALAWTLSETVH